MGGWIVRIRGTHIPLQFFVDLDVRTIFKYLIIYLIIFQFTILKGSNLQTGILIKKSKLLKKPKIISGWHRVKLKLGDTLDVISTDDNKYYKVSYLDYKGWINKTKFDLLPTNKSRDVDIHKTKSLSATPSNTIIENKKIEESLFSKISKLYSNVVFIISSSLIGLLLFYSVRHYIRVRNFLHKKYSTIDETVKAVKDKIKSHKPEFSGLDLVPVSVSIFDTMYHMSKVDPLLISALDRLHHSQNFENFAELRDYVKSLIKGTTDERLIHKYKAYVGEEDTFSQLSSLSGNLFVPKSGTNPEFDFIYNDQKYNRAVSSDSDYLDDKLNNLPDDVNLWVGPDVDEKYLNNSRFFIDNNSLTEREYFKITSDSFDGIDNIGNFIDTIPFLTMAFSSSKNYRLYSEGKTDKKTATENVILDTASVGLGGYAGAEIGENIGDFLSPVDDGFIVPVFSKILGSVLGVIAGKGVSGWFKERHYRNALKRLENDSVIFSETYNKKAESLIDKHQSMYFKKVKIIDDVKNNGQGFFGRLLFPNVITTFSREARKRYNQELINLEKYYLSLLKLTKRRKEKEKREAGLILYAQGSDILLRHRSLIKCFNDIKLSIQNLEEEKKKIR